MHLHNKYTYFFGIAVYVCFDKIVYVSETSLGTVMLMLTVVMVTKSPSLSVLISGVISLWLAPTVAALLWRPVTIPFGFIHG